MLKNYFKIAVRNLWRSKGFSLINIAGLAIGMAAAILILLWIQNELSYDQFHKNKDRIYEAWNRVPFDGKISFWNSLPAPLARTLEKDVRCTMYDVRDRQLRCYGKEWIANPKSDSYRIL